MRKKNFFKVMLPVLLLTGLVTLTAQEPVSMLPESADAVLFVRIDQIQADPALADLAATGEMDNLTETLTKLGMPPAAVAVAYFGTASRLLLASAPEYAGVSESLHKKYDKARTVLVDDREINGCDSVKMTYLHDNLAFHSCYEAVWLTPDLVAAGDDDFPIPLEKLSGRKTTVFQSLVQPGTLAAAQILHPDQFGFDIMGVCRKLENVTITASSHNGTLVLQARAIAKESRQLRETAQLTDNAIKIMLVALFGDAPELFTAVQRNIKFSTDRNEIHVKVVLDNKLRQQIQTHYRNHADSFRNFLEKQNVKH